MPLTNGLMKLLAISENIYI